MSNYKAYHTRVNGIIIATVPYLPAKVATLYLTNLFMIQFLESIGRTPTYKDGEVVTWETKNN